jgi:hypothetical protein
MSQLLAPSGGEPRAVQRYTAPDSGWWDKITSDVAETGFEAVEALPGVGNIASAGMMGTQLGMAGYDALTGDSKGAKGDLEGAENFGLNAIPVAGNIRAATQAYRSGSTVGNDASGADPSTNHTAWDAWSGGGASKINQDIGDIWSNL